MLFYVIIGREFTMMYVKKRMKRLKDSLYVVVEKTEGSITIASTISIVFLIR